MRRTIGIATFPIPRLATIPENRRSWQPSEPGQPPLQREPLSALWIDGELSPHAGPVVAWHVADEQVFSSLQVDCQRT